MKRYHKILIVCLFALLLYTIPVSPQIAGKPWGLFIIFASTILGVILQPYPMGVVALIGLSIACLLNILDMRTQALYGFSAPTTWLVACVFFISRGFIKSRLGERIAYFFIYLAGNKSLKLSYALAGIDFLFAPFIPSSTARSGGIVMPITKAICESFHSKPEDNSQGRVGTFLMQVVFHANILSSATFLTGMVSNPLAQSLALQQGIIFTWIDWFKISAIPALISFLLLPLLLYFLSPPEKKSAPEAKTLAQTKLKELGKIKRKEIILIGIFTGMLFLWIFGNGLFRLDATSVALIGLAVTIITGIVTIEDILNEHSAWNTVLWLAIFITMSYYLEQFGFIKFISNAAMPYMSQFSCVQSFFLLSFVYFLLGYFFAGNSAHVSALYVSFLVLMIATGTPPVLAAVILGILSSLYSSLTHYGSSAGSIYYSSQYVDLGTWWRNGFIVGFVNFFIWVVFGYCYWRFCGIWC